MSNELKRLELTWIGKDEKINPEPRILMYDESKSYGDQNTGNLLIHGDNLLALKALELEYAGAVKCIYIDPPYNTGSAFEYYDDNLEHSVWLSLMRPRLEILKNLLSDDGSIWISIDDDEGHYLKVLCDEVFGRSNFISTIVWQKRYSRENREAIGDSHDFILLYATNPIRFKEVRNFLPLTEKQEKLYKNPDKDPRGPWQSVSLLAQGYRPNQMYEITAPSGKKHLPPEGNCWKVIRAEYDKAIADNRVYFGSDGQGVPRRKQFLSESKGLVPWSWWEHDNFGHTDEAKKESIVLFGAAEAFPTPKPERLLQNIIHIATNPGDLILDSFLGSGTSSAVALKMGRRWIGIELGDHCYTHCIPRLKAVIDGEQGGISKSVGWQGGGGYRFLELAETLMTENQYGHLIVNPSYNAEMLAAAMVKHKGYLYNPDQQCFWKQGQQGANNYIFTTTMFVTPEYLDMIALEMAENEHLLICCEAFDEACRKRQKRITVQKIPMILLGRCEFGKDNYDLNVVLKDSEDWEGEGD